MYDPQYLARLARVPLSSHDSRAALFTDGDFLVRLVHHQHAHHFRDLYASGLIERLVDKGLLQPGKLEVTGNADFPVLIRHPRIPSVSYPYEWPARVLKEAALMVLDIEADANMEGYTLKDPHSWNITLVNARPLYLDYGSFVQLEGRLPFVPYERQFRPSFLTPLLLFNKKMYWTARAYLKEYWVTPPAHEIRRLLGNRNHSTVNRLYKFASSVSRRLPAQLNERVKPGFKEQFGRLSNSVYLRALRRQIESLRLSPGTSDLSTMYEDRVNPVPPWDRDPSTWTQKEIHVQEVLRHLQPGTVLDIGSNTGWFSVLAAQSGSRVVSFEVDESSLEHFYHTLRKLEVNVLPLFMDFQQPSASYDLRIGRADSASERFRSDLVIVLALLHHFVPRNVMSLERIAALLDSFTGEYLLTEFVPVGDPWWTSGASISADNWNLDALISGLSGPFEWVRSYPSFPEGRTLLLFRKRRGASHE